jgi:tripartite-type tricarboxylate transporter receptor subunit TctC
VMTGEVHIMFPVVITGIGQVQAGRLKALAVTSAEPSPLAPGLPTVAASGLPGFEIAGTYGLFVPAATPPAIVARLHQETVGVLNKADVKDRFSRMGLEIVAGPPEHLANLIKSELTTLGKVIRDAGIRDQ